MNSLRSSVFFRTLLFDTTAELSAYNSLELPDGATAFNNQSDALYRLDKAAGTTYDSLLTSNLVIKPNDPSPARWFMEQISGGSPYSDETYLVATAAVALSANQWAYLGSTPSTFASSASSGAYALDAATGQVTYSGPPRLVKVSAKASVLNGSSSDPMQIHACISRSDDVVAGTTTDYSSKGEMVIVTANVTAEISVERIVLLNPGTTLRLAFRNGTSEDDLTVSYYQLTVAPL